jgi:hypothetical protein
MSATSESLLRQRERASERKISFVAVWELVALSRDELAE